MSRISAIAATAAIALLLTAGSAQAAELSDGPAPVGSVILVPGDRGVAPGGVVAPGGGEVQPQAIWTWVCQTIFGACK